MKRKLVIGILVAVVVVAVAFVSVRLYLSMNGYQKEEDVTPPEVMTEWVREHIADFSDPQWLTLQGYEETVREDESYYFRLYSYPENPSQITPFFTAFVYDASLFQEEEPLEISGKCVTYYAVTRPRIFRSEDVPKDYEYYFVYEQPSGAKVEFKIGLGSMPVEDHAKAIQEYAVMVNEK